jgi:hypothetical protein
VSQIGIFVDGTETAPASLGVHHAVLSLMDTSRTVMV